MATLFAKARILLLSNIHSLLDKAIDLNSVEAVKQGIRDLETALNKAEDELAASEGEVSVLKQDVAALETKISTTNANIDLILTDGDDSNDHVALKLQKELNADEAALTGKKTELTEAEQVHTALSTAVESIRARHENLVSTVAALENQERAAKAKDRAAESLRAINSIANAGSTVSVDNIQERMRRDAATADAKLTRELGKVKKPDDTVADIKAKQALAERKARLAGTVAKAS